MYDSQKDMKRFYAIQIQNQHQNDELITGPVHLDVIFYMKMPQIKKRNIPDKRYQYHFYRPDISNLIKWVEDVVQDTQLIFKDDCQVAHITARKVYHEQPRTEFYILPIKGKYEGATNHKEETTKNQAT